jgi:hypothetical protein
VIELPFGGAAVSYPERDLYSPGSPTVPAAFLESLFVSECLHPSERLWITSAWISDIEVVDNSARQFASLDSAWPAAKVRLTAVLSTILGQSADVVVVTNTSSANRPFMERMEALKPVHGSRLHLIRAANLHEKGILGERFMLDGSMNLTYHGVYINEEHLIYRTDPAKVAERRRVLEARWKDHLRT